MSLSGFSRIGQYTLPATSNDATLAGFVLKLKNADFDAGVLSQLDLGGGDLRFSSDSAGVTQLACEVVSLNKDSDDEVYVGPFSATTGTIVYIWGDNTGESQPAADAAFGSEAVWVDYEAVCHCVDYTDSTGGADLAALYGGLVPPESVDTEFNKAFSFVAADNTMIGRDLSTSITMDADLTEQIYGEVAVYDSTVSTQWAGGLAGAAGRDYSHYFYTREALGGETSLFVRYPIAQAYQTAIGGFLTPAGSPYHIGKTYDATSEDFSIIGRVNSNDMYSVNTYTASTESMTRIGLGGFADASPQAGTSIVAEYRLRKSLLSIDHLRTEEDNMFSTLAWGTMVAEGVNAKPVITLTSASSINITEGDTWDNSVITYTAEDPEDGVITGDVVLDDSAVDDDTVGSYGVTLNVVDSEALAADEVIVTVNVLSAAAPTVSVSGSFQAGDTVTWTATNITPTEASIEDGQGNTLDLTGVTSTTGALVDWITDEVVGLLFGTCTLTVGDGVDTASTSIPLDPPDGYQFVNVGSGTLNLAITGLIYGQAGVTPSENFQVISPTALVVLSDLNTELDEEGEFTVYIASPDAPLFESFTYTQYDPEPDAEVYLYFGALEDDNGLVSAASAVIVSVNLLSDLSQVFLTTTSWGVDAVPIPFTDESLVSGTEYCVSMYNPVTGRLSIFPVTAV